MRDRSAGPPRRVNGREWNRPPRQTDRHPQTIRNGPGLERARASESEPASVGVVRSSERAPSDATARRPSAAQARALAEPAAQAARADELGSGATKCAPARRRLGVQTSSASGPQRQEPRLSLHKRLISQRGRHTAQACHLEAPAVHDSLKSAKRLTTRRARRPARPPSCRRPPNRPPSRSGLTAMKRSVYTASDGPRLTTPGARVRFRRMTAEALPGADPDAGRGRGDSERLWRCCAPA